MNTKRISTASSEKMVGGGGEMGKKKNNTFVTLSHFLYRIGAKLPAPSPQAQMVIVYSKGA